MVFGKSFKELQSVKGRVVEVELKITYLDEAIKDIQHKFNQLRGLVNRKVGYTSETEQIEKNKSPDGLDFLRGNGNNTTD